jgi:hypothetical protein
VNLEEFYELAERLCENAVGVNAEYAAVGLIANHRVWLLRRAFAPFIRRGRHHGEPTASIRWRAAHTTLQRGDLPCSGSEADVLRIAAGLGAGVPVDLRDALGNLDHANIAHVLRAIATANGTWPITLEATHLDDDGWAW